MKKITLFAFANLPAALQRQAGATANKASLCLIPHRLLRVASFLLVSILAGWISPPIEALQDNHGIKVDKIGLGFNAKTELPNLVDPKRKKDTSIFVAKMGHWVTFQVILEALDKSYKGTLTVRNAPQGKGTFDTMAIYSKKITLPQGAKKRITFPVYASSLNFFELSFQDDKKGLVSLSGEKQSATLFQITSPDEIPLMSKTILIATESISNFSHLLKFKNPDGTDDKKEFVQDPIIIPIMPADLPLTPLEYSFIDLLILDDISLDSLSEAQQRSIYQYVSQGGSLIVCLFRNPNIADTNVIKKILPADPLKVENFAIMPQMDLWDEKYTFTSPQAIMTLKPKANATTWFDKDIMINKRVGNGNVIVAGFPISARFLEGYKSRYDLVDHLLRKNMSSLISLPGTQSTIRNEISRALKLSVVKKIPAFENVATMLGVYSLAILIVPYLLFKALGKLEFAWVLILVFTVGGLIGIYNVGIEYLQKNSTATRISIVELDDNGGPWIRHNFWTIFSARGEKLNLAFEDVPVVCSRLRDINLGKRSKEEQIHVSFDDDFQLRDIKTHFQDSVLFETTDSCSIPGSLHFEVSIGRNVISGKLNRSKEFPLDKAWIIYRDKIITLTELSKESVTFSSATSKDDTNSMKGIPLESYRQLVSLVKERSMSTGQPILLFTYAGNNSLKSKDITEEGIHYGILRPDKCTYTSQRLELDFTAHLKEKTINQTFPVLPSDILPATSGGVLRPFYNYEYHFNFNLIPSDYDIEEIRIYGYEWNTQVHVYQVNTQKWILFSKGFYQSDSINLSTYHKYLQRTTNGYIMKIKISTDYSGRSTKPTARVFLKRK